MNCIFDKFPSRAALDRFVVSVRESEPELALEVYESELEAATAAVFPFILFPPVVLVERPDWSDDDVLRRARELGAGEEPATGEERENALELLAVANGGRYAGT